MNYSCGMASILLISASWAARITGVSHWRPAWIFLGGGYLHIDIVIKLNRKFIYASYLLSTQSLKTIFIQYFKSSCSWNKVSHRRSDVEFSPYGVSLGLKHWDFGAFWICAFRSGMTAVWIERGLRGFEFASLGVMCRKLGPSLLMLRGGRTFKSWT
jgi:hypothetical protein